MVIRTRLRAFLLPVLLYAISGSVGGYFVWHAINGERGLKAKEIYLQQIAELQIQSDTMHQELERWQRRVAMMQGDAIDRDLLEEQARITLGWVGKADLTIFLQDVGNKRP